MITFNGKQIKGTHDAVAYSSPELQVSRTYFWGLQGESEITGGKSGRNMTVYMWLHDKHSSRTAIEDRVKEIMTWVGEHGVLVETDARNSMTKTYENVTFTGVEPITFPNRESVGPIKDYAGTVDGGWIQAVNLKFYQLITEPSTGTP